MADELERNIAANLEDVERRIAAACARVGRGRNEVTLIAVSKTRSPAEILAAYRAGVRHFGENRIEEAEEKIPLVRESFIAGPVTWHMVGHVQSRKARRVVEFCDVIHSVDSLHLAARLERFAAELGKRVPILLEVNVSGEESKYGFAASTPVARADFLSQVGQFAVFTHLRVEGLMTMAPIVPDPEQARPVFRALRELREALRDRAPFSSWAELSMGMTDDFEVAIEEGATMVRIGRAIFGPASY
jgi:pyridoxal phosphate enzyme (YggS family)